jgi:hypothetical protein
MSCKMYGYRSAMTSEIEMSDITTVRILHFVYIRL